MHSKVARHMRALRKARYQCQFQITRDPIRRCLAPASVTRSIEGHLVAVCEGHA